MGHDIFPNLVSSKHLIIVTHQKWVTPRKNFFPNHLIQPTTCNPWEPPNSWCDVPFIYLPLALVICPLTHLSGSYVQRWASSQKVLYSLCIQVLMLVCILGIWHRLWARLHETGKRVRVSKTGTDTKRDLPKFWKRGNTNMYNHKAYMIHSNLLHYDKIVNA